MTPTSDIGLIGLGVMGRNLALNLDEHGFRVSVFDRSPDALARCVASQPQGRLRGCAALADFVASVARPRVVWLMVNAGAPVDAVLEQLVPLLAEGDIVVDGGNSLYIDTERRDTWLREQGLRFIGAGISGAEQGAQGPGDRARRACINLGGHKADLRVHRDQGRRPALRHPHWPRRRRALLEDGAQRHRVRRHAAHLRGLRDVPRRLLRHRRDGRHR